MNYLSVCSGIEAASVAWSPLGWEAVAFSEIEKFPSAVLSAHYPSVPNWGDMTRFEEWPDATIDVLVGGTPCQSFSVAGLRRGLADPRGNLALTYLAIADRYRPKWLVWENVPGVLSSDEGRAFGALLGGMEELRYGWAYRTLDAQYFGVAQRRRRVFVVASLAGWAAAGSVLFEPESLRGDSAPRRETGQEFAGTIGTFSGGCDENYAGQRRLIPANPICMATGQGSAEISVDGSSPTLTCNHEAPIIGFNGRQDPVHGDIPGALDVYSQTQCVAFDMRGREGGAMPEGPHDTANIRAASGGSSRSYVAQPHAVRRLTPIECERLQGFPDGYTAIQYRGRPAADGLRYKALGNSMAVPVMGWIGRRLDAVNSTMQVAT